MSPADVALEFFRAAAGVALRFLPVAELREHLDTEAARRAELAVDVAEAAKFRR